MSGRLIVIAAVLALICAFSGVRADNARKLTQMNEPTAPDGWWQSLTTVGPSPATSPWCGLRDFPPIPDGEGEARMLCGGYTAAFNPMWVWKATKPDGSSVIRTGEDFNLRIFNQMLTYCRLRSSKMQLYCGVGFNSSSFFQIEKVGDASLGVVVDFNVDTFYLKSRGLYCSISGKTNSAYIFCSGTSATKATVFKMPYSHYSSLSLTSVLSNEGCGANAIVMDASLPTVNCTANTAWKGNYYTKFVVSAKNPGSSVITTGTPYSFSFYNELWHYHYYYWALEGLTNSVTSQERMGPMDSMYFAMEVADVPSNTPINTDDVVALKNTKTGLYCGIATATAPMKCDQAAFPTQPGYFFIVALNY